ncbi:unnamed protein product [Gulo gulo]|uniref:Uncharacterized protein n=1 Tax=Gulo gulo TaxID=48420 RepID=A0A9X9LWC1_GULGU|nr:unnamed protein product [Gulo gulo]
MSPSSLSSIQMSTGSSSSDRLFCYSLPAPCHRRQIPSGRAPADGCAGSPRGGDT